MNRVLTLLLFISTQAFAQNPKFIRHEISKDKKDLKISRILQSHDGFLWVGTQYGLFRYDGISSQLFTFPDSSVNEEITAVYQDKSKKIWAGSVLGNIYYWENGLLHRFDPEEGLPKKSISAILEDKSGRIWFATKGEGIYCREGARLYNLNSDDGLADDFTYSLLEDKKGRIWTGTDGGISIIRFEDGKKRFHKLDQSEGMPDQIVHCMKMDDAGKIWAGMQDKGVCIINPNNFKVEVPSFSTNWSYGAVLALMLNGKAAKIATDEAGLVNIDPVNGVYLYNRTNSKIPNKLSGLSLDREGNIWVLDNSAEPISFNELFTVFLTKNNTSEGVYAVCFDSRKRLWYSDGRQLHLMSGNNSEAPDPRFRDIPAICIYEDPQKRLWFGTFGKGVYRYDPVNDELRNFTEKDGLANNNVLSIHGNASETWFGTLGGISNVRQGRAETFTSFKGKQGPGASYIYQVFTDSKGRTWLATDGHGIICHEKGRFRKFTESDGLKSKVFYSIAEDKSGALWFSSQQDGIYRYNGSSFRQFALKEGLRDLSISAIVADVNNKLLIISNKGVDVLDCRSNAIMYHGEELGLDEIEPNLNAVHKDAFGRVWLGSKPGLIKYDPSAGKLWIGPKPVIKDMLIFLSSAGLESNRELSYNQNHISFDYSGIWLHDPSEVRYMIKLEGYDNDWINSYNHFITYPRLPPGKYRFRIKASSGANFDQAEELNYSFTIKAPFWRTWWFISLLLVLLIVLMWFITTRRVKKTRAAEVAKKEKVVFHLETLRSQVNPHFLFNSFNTLAGIIEHDQSAAVEYVERLSDFYRSILKYQDVDLIHVKEELELLENYYQLQKKRFGKKLILELDERLKQLDFMIAPLSVQLLFENAIKHNVVSAANPLLIRIYPENEYLVLANRLQAKNEPEKESGKGLLNIQSRYQLLHDKSVIIEKTESMFIVKIPFIPCT